MRKIGKEKKNKSKKKKKDKVVDKYGVVKL